MWLRALAPLALLLEVAATVEDPSRCARRRQSLLVASWLHLPMPRLLELWLHWLVHHARVHLEVRRRQWRRRQRCLLLNWLLLLHKPRLRPRLQQATR